MRLVSCYIENFGSIKQKNFKFGNLTSFCEKNGYGKTTLASFLRAMFYGLKATRSTDKEFGDRAHYYPFEGGKFGGNLVFEKDGATYKIERFFGRKSATEDVVAFYKNGVRLTAPEDIGKAVFGMDEQSFLRTVFITSADTGSGATADIGRMLNGFVDDADYDGAREQLEKLQKEYKFKRGKGGKIDDKHDEVLRLKSQIENKRVISENLGEKYGRRAALESEIKALDEGSRSLRDRKVVLEKWRVYDGYVADADAEKQKLGQLTAEYPSGIPTVEEAKALKANADALAVVNEGIANLDFGEEKKERLAKFEILFADGVPTECPSADNLIRLETECENLVKLSQGSSPVDFPVGVPDGDEVEKYGRKILSLRESKTSKPVASKKLPLAVAIAAVIIIGIGAGLFALSAVAGGAAVGVGAALLLTGAFLYFKGQLNSIKGTADGGLENEIASFLVRYGYYSGAGVEVDFNNLSRDLQAYKSAAADRERITRQINEKQLERQNEESKLLSFLKRYGFEGKSIQSDLILLRESVSQYTALNEEKISLSSRAREKREDKQRREQSIDGTLNKYSLRRASDIIAQAAEIERDSREAERLQARIAELLQKAEIFKRENSLDIRPDGGGDTVDLDAALSEKRDRLSRLDSEIKDDETAVEKLQELEDDLSTAEEEEKRFKKKHELITKTLAVLEEAERRLKDRYVLPVKDRFLRYSELLEKTLGENVIFDKNFNVRFERNGEEKSDGHLSAGQKSLCALCLRLALIENMYSEEQPFIIMDDPFVHLDGEHTARAQALIKELASDRQIIYFCCHESRKV